MRAITRFGLAISFAVAGCSSDGTDPDGDGMQDDDDDNNDPGGDEDLPEPETGFQIVTPDIEIAPGQEVTYCYYTTVPIDAVAGVKRWESHMTSGSHHLILYLLNNGPADGTLTEDCSFFDGTSGPVWAFAAQTVDSAFAMPEGVGMDIAARQRAVVQMHYLNASDDPITAHVAINGETYESGAEYIRAAPYVTYNTQIHVDAGEAGYVSGSCQVPPDVKFFLVSTHSHRFSTRTEVTDGAEMVLETDNWEHPDTATWNAEPFYEFSSGRLDYRCEYFNSSEAVVETGDSALTDEMCMAVGYFFPATRSIFCLNSLAL